jgi:hypothetical protein
MTSRNAPTEPRRSGYANHPEVFERDEPALEGKMGRDAGQGAEPGTAAADEVRKPVGARRRSAATGRHDEGMEANETPDGLNDTDELTRQAAEDIPTGRNERDEDVPVFERGGMPPKI